MKVTTIKKQNLYKNEFPSQYGRDIKSTESKISLMHENILSSLLEDVMRILIRNLLLICIVILAPCGFAAKIFPPPQKANISQKCLELKSLKLELPVNANALKSEIKIFLTESGLKARTNGLPLKAVINSSLEKEEYILEINSKEISISGGSNAALLYGFYSLRQLVNFKDEVATVHCAIIKDKPDCKWRGLYLHLHSTDPSKLPKLKKVVRALSRQKFNTLIVDFSAVTLFKSHQVCTHGYTPEQLREFTKFAKKYHMRVIPYYQALSHVFWTLHSPERDQLLEDPKVISPNSSWCATNPKVRKFFKDILRETIEIFDPEYIHLGLDEIAWGPYRVCPECKKRDPSDLLRENIMDYYNYLKDHNVKMIMWHDSFMMPNKNKFAHPEWDPEGWKILDSLPKDIVIQYWNYSDSVKNFHEEIDYFRNKGFKVLAGTGGGFPNISTYAKELKAPNGLGLIITYWYNAGDWTEPVISVPYVNGTAFAADCGWNASLKRNDLPLSPGGELFCDWIQEGYYPGRFTKTVLPLPAGITFGTEMNNWPGPIAGKKPNVPLTVSGENVSGFKWHQRQPLWLTSTDGSTTPDLTIKPAKVNYIGFVVSSDMPANKIGLNQMLYLREMPKIAEVQVKYADGKVAHIPIRYRKEILDWNAKAGPMLGRAVWVGLNSDKVRFQFSSFLWKNSKPDSPISSLKLIGHKDGVAAVANVTMWGPQKVIPIESQSARPPKYKKIDPNSGTRPLFLLNYSNAKSFLRDWKITRRDCKSAEVLFPKKGVLEMQIGEIPNGVCPQLAFDHPFTVGPNSSLRSFHDLITIEIDSKGSGKFALYLGDSKWSQYLVTYVVLHDGHNVVQVTPSNMFPEGGLWPIIRPEKVTQIRISIFYGERVRLVAPICSDPGTNIILNKGI